MRFEVAGTETIAAPVDHVWAHLVDYEFVASCAPGIESAEAIDETHFRVVAALGAGSVKVRFTTTVELLGLRPPHFAHMTVRGDAPGSAMHAESSATLGPADGGGTRLTWSVSSNVHGTLATVGARLLKGTAKRLSAAFWRKFAKQVAATSRVGRGAPSPGGSSPRSSGRSRRGG